MSKKKSKSYTVSDGDLVLTLTQDEDGWYCVTAPFIQGLVTQAKSIPEAFEMARDAAEGLAEIRERLSKEARAAAKVG
ncbi:MAG: type II toxin-antitoxin system HicB family antitoxin [Planctomycetota bacterium]